MRRTTRPLPRPRARWSRRRRPPPRTQMPPAGELRHPPGVPRVSARRFTGDIQKGFGDDEGTLVDIVDDLGIQDERTFEARATLQFKAEHKLRGSLHAARLHGGDVQDAPRDFSYGDDRRSSASSRVRHASRAALLGAPTSTTSSSGPTGTWARCSGAKIIDLDIDAVDVARDRQRETDTHPTPVPVDRDRRARLRGTRQPGGRVLRHDAGQPGHGLEFDASARFHISDRLAVQGGYRLLSLRRPRTSPTRRAQDERMALRPGAQPLARAAHGTARVAPAGRPLGSSASTSTTCGWSARSRRTRSLAYGRDLGAPARASPRARGRDRARAAAGATSPTSSASLRGAGPGRAVGGPRRARHRGLYRFAVREGRLDGRPHGEPARPRAPSRPCRATSPRPRSRRCSRRRTPTTPLGPARPRHPRGAVRDRPARVGADRRCGPPDVDLRGRARDLLRQGAQGAPGPPRRDGAALGAALPGRGAAGSWPGRRRAGPLPEPPRRPAVADGRSGAIVRRHAVTAGVERTLTPHVLRHSFATPPARARRGPARAPGDARPRRHLHHADLHPRHARAAAPGLRPVPSAA